MDNMRTSVIISNPKRPRIDCITTGDKEGHRPFEIPQSWQTEVSDSSSMNLDQTAEEDDLPAVANISAVSVDRSAVAPRFSSGDLSSHLVVGKEVEEGQHDVNRADEPASHSQHDEEPSVSAKPNTPERSDTETVALLRRDTLHTWLGKSPEGLWRAGAGSPPDDNEGGRHEGGTDANLSIDSNDSEVKGRCVAGDAERHGRGGNSHRSGQSSLGLEGEGDKEGDGQGLRKHLSLIGEGEQEAIGRAVPSDDVNMMSSCSNEEVNPSGKVLGVKLNVENNGGNDKMDNAEASTIKDGDNTSVQSNPTVCCIESPFTDVALLVRNVPDAAATSTSLSLVIDVLCGEEGRPGTGKMIADTSHKMADHACETMMPGQITQGPSEGDNDTGPFSVIDPAVCSQAGRRDEEKSSTSQCAAGVGLSPSGIVMAAHSTSQAPIPDHLNGWQSAYQTKEVPSSNQDWCPEYFRWGLQLKGEAGNTRQSATKECFSIITNKSLNETQGEAPSETGNAVVPPCMSHPASSQCGAVEYSTSAEEKEEQNLIPAGALCEQQGPTDWSLNGPEPLNAEVETKITESILVKTVCIKGEQLPSVLHIPEKIRNILAAGTNQHQNVASDVPAFGHVTDLINPKLGQSHHQSVVPYLHTEDTFGTKACVLSPSFGYRPAFSTMDMIEHHGVSQPTDALVSGPRYITHTITYRHEAHIRFTQECFQPSPLPPSAPVSSDCTPVVVDTFEKIELSSDDDSCGDEGLGPDPLLTSSLALLESPRLQFPGTQPESSSRRELTKVEEVPGAGAVKKIHPQEEDTGMGCFDSINSRSSTISPVATLPVSQSVPATCRVSQAVLNNQSSAHDDDDDDDIPLASETFQEFDMKQQFDMVVQELQQFFEIDPYDSSDGGSVLNGPEETRAVGPRKGWTTPPMERVKEQSPACLSLEIENNVESRGDCILIAHGCSPEPAVPPHDPSTCELDQQVPPLDWTRPCLDGEDSMYTPGKHREEDNILHQRSVSSVSESRKKLEKEKKPVWTPCFQSPLSDLQVRQRQTGPERRLEPLRTCSRPIRVGLSKRAKTSHLHRNHPYK